MLFMSQDQQLAKALAAWFERHSKDPHRWRTPVGLAVRDGVSASNNWRNAPRGDPRKGYRAMVADAESGS